MMAWYNEQGPEGGIAISSRVRIARNIKGLPFTHKMNNEQFAQSIHLCREAYSKNEWLSKDFSLLELDKVPEIEQQKLVEKHLISPQILQNTLGRALILSKDEKISIMINEEDHIRIQVVAAGLELEALLKTAEEVADALAEKLDFCYSSKFGYLTSCPTNLGTGMRASAMLHLPALTESGYMSQLLAAVSRMGIAVRGMYGEGTKAVGNIYQVSNQITLGISEHEIVKRLLGIIQNILNKEKETRNRFQAQAGIALEDKIFRSYGILKYARILSSAELLSLISDVREGVDMGIIPDIDPAALNSIIIETSPAHIASMLNQGADARSRDAKRAEIVSQMIV